MTIYFDMDGTLVNLFGIKGWKESIINEDVTPFEIASTLYDKNEMEIVINELKAKGFEIGIISYTTILDNKEYAKKVARAKREWLKNNFPYATEIHLINGKTPKHKVAKDNGILVDDCKRNREEWNLGTTINAYRVDLVKELRGLI